MRILLFVLPVLEFQMKLFFEFDTSFYDKGIDLRIDC